MNTEADKYRHKQAQVLLDLFTEANGFEARNMEELTTWAVTENGRELIFTRTGKVIPKPKHTPEK